MPRSMLGEPSLFGVVINEGLDEFSYLVCLNVSLTES